MVKCSAIHPSETRMFKIFLKVSRCFQKENLKSHIFSYLMLVIFVLIYFIDSLIEIFIKKSNCGSFCRMLLFHIRILITFDFIWIARVMKRDFRSVFCTLSLISNFFLSVEVYFRNRKTWRNNNTRPQIMLPNLLVFL